MSRPEHRSAARDAVNPGGGADDESVVLAGGAVLWRGRAASEGTFEVAVVHRPKYDDWSLPKGKVDAGEHLLETAVREVWEETGFRSHIGRSLGATSYIALGRPKRVHYWAAEAVAGAFEPSTEVDVLEWLPPDVAVDRVDRDADRAVLREFARRPVRTRVVLVMRHAKAVSRKSWDADDELRPLSRDGEAQAQRVARLLPIWRPERVLSSPSTRCLQTVAPFLGGERPDTDEVLSEPGHEQRPDAAPGVLTTLIEEPKNEETVVLCSHRPVLPALIDVLRRHRVNGVAGSLDLGLDANPLKPAEMLVAHIAGGRVVSAERHRP